MKKDSLIGPPREIFGNEEDYEKKLKYKKHMKKRIIRQEKAVILIQKMKIMSYWELKRMKKMQMHTTKIN